MQTTAWYNFCYPRGHTNYAPIFFYFEEKKKKAKNKWPRGVKFCNKHYTTNLGENKLNCNF